MRPAYRASSHLTNRHKALDVGFNPVYYVFMVNHSRQFTKYLKEVVDVHDSAYPDLRWGQAYFNVLYSKKRRLADELRGTDFDPFYSDHKIPAFLDYIATHWND
jgi:hypothetical protein